MLVNFMYHDILPYNDAPASSRPANPYEVSAKVFESQLKELLEGAGRPAGLVTNIALQTGENQLLDHTVSFDDGEAGAVSTILPILEKYGAKGHFFIPTFYIGKEGYLTAEDIKSIDQRGHNVGSHGHFHNPELNACAEEWNRSIIILREILGHEITTASVPCGKYQREVAISAASVGIRWLFTSEPTVKVHQVDGSFVVGRYFIKQNTTTKTMKDILVGNFPARERQLLAWNIKKKTRQIAGGGYLKLRKWKLGDTRAVLSTAKEKPSRP